MKNLFALLLLIFSIPDSFAQRTAAIYLDAHDSMINRYIAVYPEGKVAGVLILIPGMGETPENAFLQTGIPVQAARQQLLTIIPTFRTGVTSLGFDDATQQSFLQLLDEVMKREHLSGVSLYVGGMSIGGTCAVKFAELAVKHNYAYKPAAVFAIDPPLDFQRFYNMAKRNMRLTKNGSYNTEDVYITGRLEQALGGSPEEVREKYFAISPYSFDDTTQSAIKNLTHMPLMLITEPDVQWWLKERGSDYSKMNAFDCAAMINELRRLGNNRAILVTTKEKGYRQPDHKRHPHSWSIADPGQVINWLLTQ